MPAEADWDVLAGLFAGEPAAFRHRMGLSGNDPRAFHAPTTGAAFIRAQKRAVLESADAGQYLLETDEGRAAFREFVPFVGAPLEMPDDAPQNWHALNRTATLTLEADYLLLAPPDWRLTWASVCFPTRWSLAGKARQPLPAIHGAVPGLNAELGRKIDGFFGRMAPGQGWSRANWGLSSSARLNQHPSLPYTPLTDDTPTATIFVRIESQNFARLPDTGAIAFGIRVLNFPFAEVAARPEIAAGLRAQLRTLPADVAAYKGIPGDFWRRL